jgi:hypothetical protein
LTQFFDRRHILAPELWQEAILPSVRDFIGKYVEFTNPVHLFLDTHGAVAFAAGYYSDSKGRSSLVPVQCGIERMRELWPPTGGSLPADRDWRVESKQVHTEGTEVAVAISITHPITGDAFDYAERELPQIGELLSFDVLPRPGRTSIAGGGHAYQLAEELAQRLVRIKKKKQPAKFHLFIAGPNGFQFHLGALSHLFGDCVFYEFDFEARKLGAYSPAITLHS